MLFSCNLQRCDQLQCVPISCLGGPFWLNNMNTGRTFEEGVSNIRHQQQQNQMMNNPDPNAISAALTAGAFSSLAMSSLFAV